MTAEDRRRKAQEFAALVDTILVTEPEVAPRLLRLHAVVFGRAEFKTWLQAEKAAGRRRTRARDLLRPRAPRPRRRQ
jgi:hypothetical protein